MPTCWVRLETHSGSGFGANETSEMFKRLAAPCGLKIARYPEQPTENHHLCDTQNP